MKQWGLRVLLILGATTAAIAAVQQATPGAYDHLTLQRSGGLVPVRGTPLVQLPVNDPLRDSWTGFQSHEGGEWNVWLDERTALPTLALIHGKRLIAEEVASEESSLDVYETFAREFLSKYASAAGPDHHVALDRGASGRRGGHVWHVRFAQRIGGVRVEGARFEFHVSRGNLVALGSRLWAPVRVSPVPTLSAIEARGKLDAYVRPAESHGIRDLLEPELLLIPLNSDPLTHRLVWRFQFTDYADIASWTGEIDAHSGEVVAFWDDTKYDRIKGAVNPFSDDGLCMDQGCPEEDFPLPYVQYTENGGAAQFAGQHGRYDCTIPDSTIETTLDGQFVLIQDQCGPILESTVCGGEIDLGMADGVNCNVAAGSSAGNTDAARTTFYHVTMANRKARFWMGPNAWLDSTVTARTNSGGGCNASFGGNTINMQSANAVCGNTGQQQGLVTHEWGHGLDHNDGGGTDNPGEAYADIVALIEGRQSCISRGFNKFDLCSGYGDTCLTCTGLREMDWNARASQTPATPTGFLSTFCPTGGGPCGKETHCESHLTSEAFYDLATRDLTAMGLDLDSAWQLTERLWYQTRPGSGGEAYSCTLPNSDSCTAGSWYHQLRLLDDDDGNLSNGTPHAAAIFAAFDRHDIACGVASDPENQNTSSCPALSAPVASFTAQTNALDVQWNSVANASAYRVYRTEIGCNRAQLPLAEVAAPATSFLDNGLANGVPVYYRVQAIGTNSACESPVSNCLQAAAQQLAGKIRFDQSAYACTGSTIGLEVTDINHPSSSMTVTVQSDSETSPETVTLNETPPGSARYTGSIPSTTGPAAADGQLSIAGGDTLTAEYVDLDNGVGGMNVIQQAVALVDCQGPLHLSVAVNNITDSSAVIDWTTSEFTTGQLEWGLTPALGNVVPSPLFQGTHSVFISPFTECDRVYFRITSVDGVGNVAVAEADGSPFGFNTATIGGIFYQDDFETDLGWTLEGDWEIGPPQGLGTAPGDPTTATGGTQVLGQDLSGQGSNPGDYEFNTVRSATSPVIDTSAFSNVEVHFDRWLNTHLSSWANLEVKNSGGTWQNAWSDTNGHTDVAWTRVSYNISQAAAGNANFQLRFFQNARFGVHAGWNVDGLFLRDGDAQLHGACGGCVGTPTFAGLVTATDLDPCADTGIELSWFAAPAWGSGTTGSYSVYRSTTPGFTPSPANRIATGVSGPTWTDTTATAETEYHYVVRAENDETCSSGPANNGTVEANLVYVMATNATGGAGSGQVGDTLGVGRSGNDVQLGWTPVAGATGYSVERSTAPDAGFVLVGQPTGATFNDPGALNDGQTWFYLVTNDNACGN